jgi:glycosyltransferase involved in cell wall biosynthesis
MKISYLVTVHNEVSELHRLLVQLSHSCGILEGEHNDEIVVLDDFSTDSKTQEILKVFASHPCAKIVQHKLNNDFGVHKTFGSRQCTGDYIVQCDADEYLSQYLLENMHEIIESNPTVELYRVPRVNIVRGATQEDARKWGWHMSKLPQFGDLPIINWHSGDYQARIYKNSEKIKWHKPLHETIVGAEYTSALPLDVDYAIIHDKTIDRQRAQNEFYNKNWSQRANMGHG